MRKNHKRRPLGAEQKGATNKDEVQLFSGEKGLWSVAEEALLSRGAFSVRVSAVGGWISLAAALLEAIAVAVHLQDVDVMSNAVEQSAFRAEDLGPFLEGQVAGHQR